MRLFPLTIALGALALTPVAPARAAEMVWSGLVIANNAAPEATPLPAELSRFEETLRNFFNYKHYEIIGQSRKTLKTGEEDWMATSKYFSLHVDSKTAQGKSYLLNLQLWQERKLLLETEAKLTKSSPLVIRGPYVGDGQLMLLLVIE